MDIFNRKKKKRQKGLESLASKYASLDQMAKSGMISINISSSRVFFSATLASLYMAKEKKWTGFLNIVRPWFEYKVREELRNRYFKDVEAKAVRNARKKYAVLTKEEIREIRDNARSSVNVDDISAPEIGSFEFFIASGTVITPKSEVIVVGTYAKGEFAMMPYEDIVRSVKP